AGDPFDTGRATPHMGVVDAKPRRSDVASSGHWDTPTSCPALATCGLCRRASTALKTSSVSRAALRHENRAAFSRLAFAIRCCNVTSANTDLIWPARAVASLAAKNLAAAPATSRKTGMSAQITGAPNDWASTTGRQKPSFSDVLMKQVAPR